MQPDVIKDVRLLFAALGQDSQTPDRAVAIICAAYAEKYLGVMLASHLQGGNRKLRDKMLAPEGMLGPMVNRIDMASALGLIGPLMTSDLRAIASIRNKFAHHLEIESFDHLEITTRLKNLRLVSDPVSIVTKMGIAVDDDGKWDQFRSNRNRFIAGAGLVCLALSEPYDPSVHPASPHHTEG